MYARRIQRYWTLYKSKYLFEKESVLEAASVFSSVEIDYTFRTEKLFNFSQIEIDQFKKTDN